MIVLKRWTKWDMPSSPGSRPKAAGLALPDAYRGVSSTSTGELPTILHFRPNPAQRMLKQTGVKLHSTQLERCMCIRLLFVKAPSRRRMANHIRSLCTLIDPARYSITLAVRLQQPICLGPSVSTCRYLLQIDSRLRRISGSSALYRLMRQGDYDLHTRSQAALLAIWLIATKVPWSSPCITACLQKEVSQNTDKRRLALGIKNSDSCSGRSQRKLTNLTPQAACIAAFRYSNGISPDAFAHAVDADRVRQAGVSRGRPADTDGGAHDCRKRRGRSTDSSPVLVRQGNYYFALAGAGPTSRLPSGRAKRDLRSGCAFSATAMISPPFCNAPISSYCPHTAKACLDRSGSYGCRKTDCGHSCGRHSRLIEHDVTGVVEPRQPRI